MGLRACLDYFAGRRCNSGPVDVFSMFDSITVTHSGLHQNRSVTALDSSVNRSSASALQTTERTAFQTADRALQTLNDQSPQDTLIGDLAFEQITSNPRKVRGG
jgi:hypothetical protein